MINNYHGRRFNIPELYNGHNVIEDRAEQRVILSNFPQTEDVCDFLNAIWEKYLEGQIDNPQIIK